MAWGSVNGLLFQKNSKFESFLKRTLSEEVFERVRAYESCIVISEKENKAFKFVVLTDEKIYLTENPPKTLQEAVHLKDVTSVELVNEFPDFLAGQERTNTQQIAVTYTTTEPRRRSLRRSKKSPRGSQTELNGDRSNASTPLGYSSSVDSSMCPDDQGYLTQSSGSLSQSRPTSRGSIKASIQAKKKKKGLGLNDSWDHDSILRSLKEIEEDTLEDIEEDRLSVIKSQGPSRTTSAVNKNSNSSRRGSNYHRELPALPTPGGGGSVVAAGDGMSIRSLSQQSMRPLPPMPRTGAFETVAEQTDRVNSSSSAMLYPSKGDGKGVVVVEDDDDDDDDDDGDRRCSFFRCCGGQKNQVSPVKKNSFKEKSKSEFTNQEDTASVGPGGSLHNGNANNSFTHMSAQFVGHQPPSRGSSMRGSRSNTPIIESERNLNELNVSSSDLGRSGSLQGLNTLSVGEGGLLERRKCVLNLYLLNLTSPLLMLMRSAWSNYIIRATLSLEPEQISISTVTDTLSARNSDNSTMREKVERTYSHLKRDLFHPNLSMEEQYVLVDRLRSTTKSSSMMKKLFWKTPDMFSFLINQLQKYLPHSHTSLDTEEGKAQRADEIEFTILILSTINLMFRETETLPSRFQTVILEGGKLLTDLLQILMCQPELPYRPLTLSKHWSDPLAGNKKTEKQKNLNEELARLKTDYTRTAISSTFELFLVAKQAHTDAMPILTVTGMVGLFSERKAIEKFVDRLLSQVMELVSLSRFDILTPTQAMMVYQMFSLLQTFLEHNKTIVVHIRNNYYEEFKYFIQAPAVSRKLPLQYPITANTISLIDQVVARVLGNTSNRGSKYQS